MSYYPEPDSHKVKLILDLPSYATKKNYKMLQALIHLIYLLKEISLF